ncbi:hypothetical protein [Phenylobacterium sp.]|uniref:hypothetical protein n=1 Tax=Phenylobacterium sp. TaxID=1871053 RepID=UPI00272F0C90|nr:hypothetical protein [Phenylobacterium sp.]MDP1598989.1 hypothetical protein [Phenylobacterium sp.]
MSDIRRKSPPSTRVSSASEPLDLRLLTWAEGLLFGLYKVVAARELLRRKAWAARPMAKSHAGTKAQR